MHIRVENKYVSSDDSCINVHCRRSLDTNFTPINPAGDSLFPDTDKVVLYVEETHLSAPVRGKKRFGYIKIDSINAKAEWRNGNDLAGVITVIGTYDPNPEKCEVHIQLTTIGQIELSEKPTTVNVQVGGN